MKYEITGAPMPVVTCTLDTNESMFNEGGSMCTSNNWHWCPCNFIFHNSAPLLKLNFI